MGMDIIARGMASQAANTAKEALDELSMVIEGTMNAAETEFTDKDGNVVTPDQNTVYQDTNTYVYYRWNGTSYYAVSDPRGVVRYTAQSLTAAEQEQVRNNIGLDNIENGSGTGALQQKQDGSGGTFDFTGKNPNAYAVDSSLTGNVAYGATGDFAVSIGGKSQASGKRAHAEGTTTVAKGNYAHSEGSNTVARGTASHAEGTQTFANASGAHAEGNNTQALKDQSHAEGSYTIADAKYAHAEGDNTTVTGQASHVEGSLSRVKSIVAHAEGTNNFIGAKESGQPSGGGDVTPSQPGTTPAAGDGSHAEGRDNYCYGHSAHVEGAQNVIEGNYAHVGGIGNTAGYDYQTVIGKYNDNKSNTLFEIGKGVKNSPSNAFEVYNDGSAAIGAMGSSDLSVSTKKYVDDNKGTKLYLHHVSDGDSYVDIVTLTSSPFQHVADLCGTLRLGVVGSLGNGQIKAIYSDDGTDDLTILTQDNYYGPSQDFTYTISAGWIDTVTAL